MRNAKDKKTPARPSKKWQILIGMDPKSGVFTYVDKAHKNTDLHRLFPINGDTVEWSLDTPFKKQAFQISFSDLNPFNNGAPVSYRGSGGAVLSAPVNFPENYLGSKICKYTLTTSNGWFDDPDVVPVPADAGLHPNDALFPAVCQIQWIVKDNAVSGVEFVPNTAALNSKVHMPVEWKWASNQPFATEDFILTFDTPLPADCAADNDSTELDLVLTPGLANTTFTASTRNFTTATPGTLKVT